MFIPTKSQGNFDVVSIDSTYCHGKKLSKFRRSEQTLLHRVIKKSVHMMITVKKQAEIF
jgi:hypothetical protein